MSRRREERRHLPRRDRLATFETRLKAGSNADIPTLWISIGILLVQAGLLDRAAAYWVHRTAHPDDEAALAEVLLSMGRASSAKRPH